MKGVIFNIAEKFVETKYGNDALEALYNEANFSTKDPFIGPLTYPDADMLEMVRAGCKLLKLTPDELLYNLGVFAFSGLAERHPVFLKDIDHPKEFLKTVENVIHIEVKKLYEDADLPTFQYEEPHPNELIITYFSKRKLYSFMSGLIEGVAQHYKVPIEQKKTMKTLKGHEVCDYHLFFGS